MSLENFLNKFNSSDGKYAYSIDPYKYFAVSVKFDEGGGFTSNGLLKELGSNFLNNVTGGLYSRITNGWGGGEIGQDGQKNIPEIIKKSQITDAGSGRGSEGIGGAIMDSLMGDKDQNVFFSAGDKELNLTYFTQECSLPSISIPDFDAVDTVVGSLKTHKMAVETDSKEFSLKILNTKVSLIDRVFYPWMREVSYPYWSYDDRPYTTATITIDFTSHNDISYVFLGSRPTKIESLNPTNALDTNMTRGVTFAFDFMYIKSNGMVAEGLKDTLKNAATSIINKAASTIGL